jgi:hypothetical protein
MAAALERHIEMDEGVLDGTDDAVLRTAIL